MTSQFRSSINRRALLKNGGLTLSLGAIIAACGAGRSGPTDPGKLGVDDAPEPDERDTTVDDAVLLRTLQSLEYTAIDVHTRLLALRPFGGFANEVQRFVEHHRDHADAVGGLAVEAGGSRFPCANPFIAERAVEPLLAAVAESDDAERDALAVVEAFESLLGASYQAIVARLSDSSLRSAAMQIGEQECRHAAIAALAINPDPVAPTMTGGREVESEFPARYAIPATFGQLAGIELVVGAPQGDDQVRYSTILQTPAENSFVYNGDSC